jgi:hypothetical protein
MNDKGSILMQDRGGNLVTMDEWRRRRRERRESCHRLKLLAAGVLVLLAIVLIAWVRKP